MTATVSSMVISALIMNGQKSVGSTLTTDEQNAYLDRTNAMMESWSIDRTMVYSILQENFALTVSTASYTIGTGGVFNTVRPAKIVNAFVRDAQNSDNKLRIIPQAEYAQIILKTSGNSYPNTMYYDAADVAGLATIYVYPAPIASLTLYINSYKSLQSFSAMSTVLVLPPGYQRAIESNLAIELDNGRGGVSQLTMKIARESKAALRTINAPEVIARFDSMFAGGSGAGNIFTGP